MHAKISDGSRVVPVKAAGTLVGKNDEYILAASPADLVLISTPLQLINT